MSWYYAVGDERRGPVEDAEFQQLAEQGVIAPDTLVWQNGMDEWQAYREIGAATAASPAASGGGQVACQECARLFNPDDLISLGGRQICGGCKTKVVQQMQEGAVSDDDDIRNANIKHEASIQSAGFLYFLGGGFWLLMSFPMFISGEAVGVSIGIVVLAVAVLILWTASKLRKLKSAARIPTGILSGLGLLLFPLGTLINGYILYLVFSQKGTYIMSDEYLAIRERTPHIKYRTSPVIIVLVVLFFGLIGLGMVGALFQSVN